VTIPGQETVTATGISGLFGGRFARISGFGGPDCGYHRWKCEPGLAILGFVKLAVGRQETEKADTPR